MEKERSFTLIELLVVIAIIGLLASIIIVVVNPAKEKTRDAQRKTDINQIRLAMELCLSKFNCGAEEGEYFVTGTSVDNIDTDEEPCFLCPVSNNPSGAEYSWIDNSSDKTKYCVYVKLKSVDDTWIAASHKGTCFTLTAVPSNLDCWTTCP